MSAEQVKVLMVEDDEPFAGIITHALKMISMPNFLVTQVNSLRKAFLAAKENSYDVVLLDLSLPDSSGIATLRTARSRIMELPIIVLTGNEDYELAVEAVRCGAQDYLIKHHTDGHFLSLAIRYAVERKKNEKYQREQLHFLQSVMDNVPCPLFIKDTNLVFRACNMAFERMAGMVKEQVIGRSVLELFAPQVGEALRSHELKLLCDREAQSYELAVARQDGYAQEMLFHETVYRRGDGELAGLVGVAFDITDRKIAERALVESEKYINLLLNSIQVGVAVVDAETSRFIDVNDQAVRMFGMPREEVVGSLCQPFFAPSPDSAGCPLTFLTDADGSSFETLLVTSGGASVNILKTVVRTELEGRAMHIESFVDIDDRKRMERELARTVDERNAELRQANETLRREVAERERAQRALEDEHRLFTSGPVIMFKWRASDGWPVEYVSPNVSQLGYRPQDLIQGQVSFSELIDPADRGRVATEVASFGQSGAERYEQDYRVLRPCGGTSKVHDHTVVVRDEDGRVTHYHGYLVVKG